MEEKENYWDDAPPLLKDYLFYMNTVMGRSEKTSYEYYLDIRMFFRYLKRNRGIVSKEIPFDEISISDVDADLVKSVTLSDAYAFLNYVANDRKNDSRARARKVSSLKGFYKYLTTKTTLNFPNPLEALEVPNIRKTVPKYLSLEESIEVLDVIDGPYKERDYCIFTLFLNCGMRLSELVGLNLKDIKADSVTVLGKGNKERVIYLNDACLHALDNYLRVRPTDVKPEAKDAVFISQKGNRISRRRVQQIVEQTLQKAGLGHQGYSTHKLRHTAATLMFQYGNVDIRVLKEILGHENISTTEIYTHVSNKQMEEAIHNSPLSSIHQKGK